MIALDVLQGLRGATMATLEAKTTPSWKTTKLPEEIKQVKKVSRVNGVLNFVYQHSINNQRMREGSEPNFVPLPRCWGKRLFPSPLVEHNGKFYLEVKVQKVFDVEYVNENGEVVPVTLVKPYLREKKESARQQLDKEVILRDYSLENIIKLTLNGITYK